MSYLKNEALRVLNELHEHGRVEYGPFEAMLEGLTEVDTLRDRDEALEEMWERFRAVPVKNGCIEAPFMGWGPGITLEEIHHWFDRRHSKGVGYLLYETSMDRTDQLAKLVYLKSMCIECESSTCQYNHRGECRFALVHERKARITDDDGCIDYDYQEGEA